MLHAWHMYQHFLCHFISAAKVLLITTQQQMSRFCVLMARVLAVIKALNRVAFILLQVYLKLYWLTFIECALLRTYFAKSREIYVCKHLCIKVYNMYCCRYIKIQFNVIFINKIYDHCRYSIYIAKMHISAFNVPSLTQLSAIWLAIFITHLWHT